MYFDRFLAPTGMVIGILRSHKAIIRPIIEYCSLIYNRCLLQTVALKLERIQNHCTGALPSTPVPALLADADIPTCQKRRNIQLCRYYVKAQAHPNTLIRDLFKIRIRRANWPC